MRVKRFPKHSCGCTSSDSASIDLCPLIVGETVDYYVAMGDLWDECLDILPKKLLVRDIKVDLHYILSIQIRVSSLLLSLLTLATPSRKIFIAPVIESGSLLLGHFLNIAPILLVSLELFFGYPCNLSKVAYSSFSLPHFLSFSKLVREMSGIAMNQVQVRKPKWLVDYCGTLLLAYWMIRRNRWLIIMIIVLYASVYWI